MKTQTASAIFNVINRFTNQYKPIAFLFVIVVLIAGFFSIVEKVSTQASEIRESSERGAEKNISQNAQSPAVCAQPPANLVAWYRAENNANDSQGTNHGALQNGATFAAGKVGQSFSFDGVDDSVQLPLTQTFQNFTLEAWINPLSAVSDPINQELILGQAGFGSQIAVRPGTNGGMRVVVQYRDTINSFAQVTSTVDIPLNDWTHLIGTYDGTTLKLYINGVLNAQLNPPNTAVLTCGTPYFIGGFQTVTDCNNITNQPFQFFNGLIDEASIYNRALTDAEIQAIFNAESAGKCLAPPVCTAAPSNQVSWYRAENNADDSKGANPGSFQGGSFTDGKVGQSFNITNNRVVGVQDSATLDFTNAFTAEMWVNPSAAGRSDGTTLLLGKGNLNFVGTQSYGIIFGADRRVGNRVGNGGTIEQAISTSQLPLNTFTHIATTFDGTTLRVYVNGVLETSQATSIGTLLNSTESLIIGGANFSGVVIGAETAIDETSLYNRALSDAEILAIFNAGSAGKCFTTTPTAASVSIGGRVTTANGRGISRASVQLTDSRGDARTAYTNVFGYYRFETIAAGENYVLSVKSKRYEFVENVFVLFAAEDVSEANFTAKP